MTQINAFGREIEVLVGENLRFFRDGQSGLDIEFEVPFDDDILANEATVTIYNVKPETYNQIELGMALIINAGYHKDRGSIFVGEVSYVEPLRDKPDSRLVIRGLDSLAFVEQDIQKTYQANVKATTIVRDLLSELGLPVGFFDLPDDVSYPRGYTANGKICDILKQVAVDSDALCFTSRGKVYVCSRFFGEETDFILTVENGLIGSPELNMIDVSKTNLDYIDKRPTAKKPRKTTGPRRVTYGKKDVELQEQFRVKSLLNHRFGTAKILAVRSRSYDFIYRINRGRHICQGSEFYTEMELM
ncbi:phage protein [Paenibacillus periandrae]|uniref:phage protein n=1 Tax=Paenibacillus periandrae TaxID=1761741 RepID=UPI001F0934F1|nr:hypothetical protein [Paenibacillus periandrae]